MLELAVGLKERDYGPDSQMLSHEYGVLGNLHAQLGQFDDGLRYLKRALAINQKSRNPLGEPYENLVAASMVDVATCYSRMGQHTPALELLEQAVEIEERIYGPDHKVSSSYAYACE